jgi:hypothetical protein
MTSSLAKVPVGVEPDRVFNMETGSVKSKTKLVALALVVIVAGLAGWGSYQVAVKSRNGEIALIASVNVERSVRVRKAFDPKLVSQAKDLLDAAITQDLFYMESYESAVMSNPMYARQRARSVAMVKRDWLESPPFALEDATKSYIEEVCRQTTGCPPGDIRPRPPAEEPKGSVKQ